jgi:hypothetical protein
MMAIPLDLIEADLTLEIPMLEFGLVGVGTRRMGKKATNNETKKPKKSGMGDAFCHGFARMGHGVTRPAMGSEEVRKGGWKEAGRRAEAVSFRTGTMGKRGFSPDTGLSIRPTRPTRFNPLQPASIFCQAELGTNMGNAKGNGKGRETSVELCELIADFYAKFHESSRKFAQIRPVNPRCYALLRVRPILDANCTNEREFRKDQAVFNKEAMK